MKILLPFFCIGVIATFAGACGPSFSSDSSLKEAWNKINDPLNLGEGFLRQHANLPTSGKLDFIPWADSYWPTYMGGLNARWGISFANKAQNFNYTSPSLIELKQMSSEQIAALSPAEKYSIYVGDYNYRLVQLENRRVRPDAGRWEGICHGWAPASLAYSEPQPVEVTNAEGIVIPFGSSDIKGLLSYYYGQIAGPRARYLGSRCNYDFSANPEAKNLPECRDVNAGAFHVALANLVGLRKVGLIADMTTDLQIWNHPIFSFSFKVVKTTGPTTDFAPGTTQELTVENAIQYRLESDPVWKPTNTEQVYTNRKLLKYIIEINEGGDVIGGKWISENHPDFAWTQEKPVFKKEFLALESLYKKSVGQ